MSAQVVFLHGIWMPGYEMAWLRHRLEQAHGFHGRLFAYPSVRGTLDENAELLAEFIHELDDVPVHLVGHSLGGIVALRAATCLPNSTVGRIVCLGSPLRGSAAARSLSRVAGLRSILGQTLPAATVDETVEHWAGKVTAEHDVGVIAGDHSAGLGRLFARFDEANDGTVAVEETRLAGVRDHLVLPVSHTGMVLSRRVADQAAAFLRHGSFERNSRA